MESIEESLSWSIRATLVSSPLNDDVRGATQLERLSEGLAIDTLADVLFRHVVRCLKLDGSVGGPLSGLAAQLNADGTDRRLKAIAAQQEQDARTVLAAIEDLQLAIAIWSHSGDALDKQLAAIYSAMEAIHGDYLQAFAHADAMLDQGAADRALVRFLRQQQAQRAAVRLMARARAGQVLTPTLAAGDVNPRDPAVTAFAQAVTAYFDNASRAAGITYYSHLIGYMEDILTLAEEAGRAGPQHAAARTLTADAGSQLRGQIAMGRTQMQDDFTEIAKAYAAYEMLPSRGPVQGL